MTPTDVEQYLMMEPMPALRLTLSSGDVVIVTAADEPFVSHLSLVLRGDVENKAVTTTSRLISLPNIATLEPVVIRPGGSTRGRRRRI
jgi:hypothetical protein